MPRNRKKLFEAWFDLYVFAFKLQVILIGLFMLYSLTAGAATCPDVNARNYMKETPIFDAVSAGDHDKVRLLLSCGADVNAVGNRRTTVLRLASNRGDVKMFNLLKAAGGKLKGDLK